MNWKQIEEQNRVFWCVKLKIERCVSFLHMQIRTILQLDRLICRTRQKYFDFVQYQWRKKKITYEKGWKMMMIRKTRTAPRTHLETHNSTWQLTLFTLRGDADCTHTMNFDKLPEKRFSNFRDDGRTQLSRLAIR